MTIWALTENEEWIQSPEIPVQSGPNVNTRYELIFWSDPADPDQLDLVLGLLLDWEEEPEMTPGSTLLEFIGGPLDGWNEVQPLQNVAVCRSPDWPQGFYYTYYSGKMIWIYNKDLK